MLHRLQTWRTKLGQRLKLHPHCYVWALYPHWPDVLMELLRNSRVLVLLWRLRRGVLLWTGTDGWGLETPTQTAIGIGGAQVMWLLYERKRAKTKSCDMCVVWLESRAATELTPHMWTRSVSCSLMFLFPLSHHRGILWMHLEKTRDEERKPSVSSSFTLTSLPHDEA